MILRVPGLSVWITNSEGDPLSEYEVTQPDKNTIECWIPSVEGENFKINYQYLNRVKCKFDLLCAPLLDGVQMSSQWTPKLDVSRGTASEIRSHQTSSSTARLYRFGQRKLTDKGDVSQTDKAMRRHLNTIQVELSWGRVGRRNKAPTYTDPKDSGPIHEKAAKKGHSGSAGLGSTISAPEIEYSIFHPEPSLESVIFIFHYAPEEWLKAREIIPRSPSPENGSNVGKKRPRDLTPEVVDLDDLETDDDEIVIIKHMIPAPLRPEQKRRKPHANVKQEESGF